MSEEESQNFVGKITTEEIYCQGMPFWSGPPSNLTAKLHPTTIPKNQGNCGACWAFSSAGALETLLLERGFPESEGDYFINITNGDNLNKDTAVSSAEVNLIGYGQLFGPQDFNKNVFQLKKQIHLLPGEYQVSTIVNSKPGSYLTILISNRDISSFQDLP